MTSRLFIGLLYTLIHIQQYLNHDGQLPSRDGNQGTSVHAQTILPALAVSRHKFKKMLEIFKSIHETPENRMVSDLGTPELDQPYPCNTRAVSAQLPVTRRRPNRQSNSLSPGGINFAMPERWSAESSSLAMKFILPSRA